MQEEGICILQERKFLREPHGRRDRREQRLASGATRGGDRGHPPPPGGRGRNHVQYAR